MNASYEWLKAFIPTLDATPKQVRELLTEHTATVDDLVPLRGNVPTRLAKLETGELDAVVLAAAGLQRLSLKPKHAISLPLDQFVPAPAQGALAVQVREGDRLEPIAAAIEQTESRLAVEAERAFLRAIGAHHLQTRGLLSLDFRQTKVKLLTNYIEAAGRRVDWGEIDPLIVMIEAKALLRKYSVEA